jgi:hypothetical protein
MLAPSCILMYLKANIHNPTPPQKGIVARQAYLADNMHKYLQNERQIKKFLVF